MKKTTLTLTVALALTACGSLRHVSGHSGIIGTWTIERAMDTPTTDAEQEPFVIFSEEGRINGNTSVNSFFGDYTLTGTRLRVSNVGMTRRLGASMEVERAVTDAINLLASVSIHGDTAYCLGEEGDTLLWLKRKE